MEESTSYGTAALKVRGKLLARLKEDGATLVLRSEPFERDALMKESPEIFFITDHYRDYPWILIRLGAVTRERMVELLTDAWRRVAPKTLVRQFDSNQNSTTRTHDKARNR